MATPQVQFQADVIQRLDADASNKYGVSLDQGFFAKPFCRGLNDAWHTAHAKYERIKTMETETGLGTNETFSLLKKRHSQVRMFANSSTVGE